MPLPRAHYPALEQTTYLNQASLGMMGQPAVDALTSFIEQVGRHGNLFMSDADEVSYYANLREQGALILGSRPEQIAILSGASELFGQLPFLLPVQPQQHVLLLGSDFPALTRPWLRHQQLGGCQIRFVEDNRAEELTETLCNAINSETAVVAISYVQYATGSKVDTERIRAAANQVGAKFVLDVTQAAGAIPILADGWGADVVVSSGYKWLGGHGGAALAALSPELLQITPPLPGWMGATNPFDFDATQLDLAPDARRFTQSTMSYGSLAALTAGIQALLKAGISKIEQHGDTLATHLFKNLNGTDWAPFRPHGSPSASNHIVSLAAPGRDIDTVVQTLYDNQIVCGSRGGRIRVSLAPYNTTADVDRLVKVLQSL